MGRNRQRITDLVQDSEQNWAEQAQEEAWELEQADVDDDTDAEQESTA